MSKNKDPAVLFYTADFLTGVSGLTMEERGQYITLLCLQHQQGPLTEKQVRLAVGELSEDVRSKFTTDDSGRLYNERMAAEKEKRTRYSESRRANVSKRYQTPTYAEHMQNICSTYAEHMENENINVNININVIKDIVEYLNGVLGAKYKFSSDYIQRTIGDRLKEGYTFPDFKAVIDKKYAEWNGTEMARFLRPETLFGPKFDSYLNAPTVPRQNGKTGQVIPSGSSFTTEDAMARALARSYGEEGGNVG